MITSQEVRTCFLFECIYPKACSINTIHAILIVAIVAIVSLGVFSMASGNNSENDIQIIAPAANHNHQGNNGSNTETKINAGTAMSGCGSDENIARPTAFRGLTPLGIMTDAIASHSGIFCIAITPATRSHSVQLGPNANHIAIPSVPLCMVMIAMNKSICAADFPDILPKLILSSLSWTNFLAHMMITIPIKIPRNTHQTLWSTHSLIIPKLAAIINPAAIALAIPISLGEMFLMKKKGITHNPQASAVHREYTKMIRTWGRSMVESICVEWRDKIL